MQGRCISSSWDDDFPDDERLTDEMAAKSKPRKAETNAGVPTVSSQSAHKGEPALVEDKSGGVKPASDVASKSNIAAEKRTEPTTTIQTNNAKQEEDDPPADTGKLFKMWTQKSIRGLDSSSNHSASGKPAPGVPRKSWSAQTAQKTEEEPSAAAPGATPLKPGSLDVVHDLEAQLGEELQQLLKDINRCGEKGEPSVKFGELFDDPEVEQFYEALVGTLKSAKKRGLISFEGQMLLKGPHDNVVVSIVKR